MFKYYDALLNRSGDALAGHFVRLFDAAGNQVDIYADESETPIITESGVANAAKSDSDGMVRFFVPSGDYDIRLYDASDTFLAAERAVPMVRGVTSAELLEDTTAASIGEANEGNVQAALDAANTAIGERATTAALASSSGGEMVGYARNIADPALRLLSSKASDIADLRDWDGLDLSGNNDNTSLFAAAASQVSQGRLFIPNGSIAVGSLPILHLAGLQIVGESKWKTVLKNIATSGPMFHNPAPANTSSFIRLANIMIDLQGEDVDAIDLNNVGNSLIEHILIKGGANKGSAAGRGIVFRSTLASSSYTNSAINCAVSNLAAGLAWDDDGNENAAYGCEAVNCLVGYDMLPASTSVDAPMVYGGRVEGCDIGLRTGAVCPGIFGLRFEASAVADVEFHTGSERPVFMGCYSASSAAIFKDIANTNGLIAKGGRFPYYELEQSVSRPIYNVGRNVFGKAGASIPTIHPSTDYSGYFYDYVLFRSGTGVEMANAAGTNRIIGLTSSGSDEITLSGYNRATASFGNVIVGGGSAVRPNANNVTDLGTSGQQYKNLLISGEVRVAASKVVGTRKTGWATATGTATRTTFDTASVTLPQLAERVKALIDDLHATAGHGLIGT